MKLLPLEASAGGIKMLIIKILFTEKRKDRFLGRALLEGIYSYFRVRGMNGELVFDDKPFCGQTVEG